MSEYVHVNYCLQQVNEHGYFLIWELSVCLSFRLFVHLPFQLPFTSQTFFVEHCILHCLHLTEPSSSERRT
jgi:hypothetical protein